MIFVNDNAFKRKSHYIQVHFFKNFFSHFTVFQYFDIIKLTKNYLAK
jgi:hypothetical protein